MVEEKKYVLNEDQPYHHCDREDCLDVWQCTTTWRDTNGILHCECANQALLTDYDANTRRVVFWCCEDCENIDAGTHCPYCAAEVNDDGTCEYCSAVTVPS